MTGIVLDALKPFSAKTAKYAALKHVFLYKTLEPKIPESLHFKYLVSIIPFPNLTHIIEFLSPDFCL